MNLRSNRYASANSKALISRAFCVVRQACVASKRNLLGCGGRAGDLEVKVLYTLCKGECWPEARGSRATANLKEARGKMLA